LFTIHAIIILDNDGHRIIAKYYGDKYPNLKSQENFESKLFSKTQNCPNAEILLYDGQTCVFKNNIDLFFYVVGDADENELLLMNVLTTLYEALSLILHKNVEKRVLLSNMDFVLLAVDELCDEGILFEADPAVIAQRVGTKQEDVPLGEQTVAQVLQNAKEQLKWSLLK